MKPFACDEEGCQFTALNKSILKSHVRNVHCNIRNFPCAQCKHRAKSKRAIDDHVNAVHLKLKIFQCGSCDFTAATKSTVTNHFKRIHLQVPLKHILHACKFCDYTTDNICNLREHEKGIHLGIKDKKCDECSFTCTALSSLKRHKLIHSGEIFMITFQRFRELLVTLEKMQSCVLCCAGSRPFKCTWLDCTYASNRKAHLQEHIACNHDRQRQFPCPHAVSDSESVAKVHRIEKMLLLLELFVFWSDEEEIVRTSETRASLGLFCDQSQVYLCHHGARKRLRPRGNVDYDYDNGDGPRQPIDLHQRG